jgi:electron transfer flavoprotein alpha/beta subunit
MNIVVCVKYVPDSTADRHFEDDWTVDRVGVDGLLSELDEYAVEQALQLKEKAGDESTVTVLSVGPEQATDAVRKSLQMGCDALTLSVVGCPGVVTRVVGGCVMTGAAVHCTVMVAASL